ncbi:MAG: hypothetical protein ACRCWQ_06815 [Bacilli bacterium]
MLISNTVILLELEKTRIANDKKQLRKKLEEEFDELYAAMLFEKENLLEELADVYIVLAQIAKMYNFTERDLVAKLEDVKNRYGKEE